MRQLVMIERQRIAMQFIFMPRSLLQLLISTWPNIGISSNIESPTYFISRGNFPRLAVAFCFILPWRWYANKNIGVETEPHYRLLDLLNIHLQETIDHIPMDWKKRLKLMARPEIPWEGMNRSLGIEFTRRNAMTNWVVHSPVRYFQILCYLSSRSPRYFETVLAKQIDESTYTEGLFSCLVYNFHGTYLSS